MPATVAGAGDVYSRIRASILGGGLPPGVVVSQVATARGLGTSRTPVREALRMLRIEGLVEAEPHGRVRVAPTTASDLEELFVIRVTLEPEALRLSVPFLTPADIARIEGCVAEMDHYAVQQDYRRWAVPHRNFHRGLTEHTGERLHVILAQMFDHSERYRRLHVRPGATTWATDQHHSILNACKARDRATAGAVLAEHLARIGFEICEILDPQYEPERLRAALDAVGSSCVLATRSLGRKQ